MNIPLNIDWQQILLHLFNFILLVGGLYVLLYRPVKKFMNKRAEYYKSIDDEANNKLSQAEATKADYEARLSTVETEITAKRSAAAKEAEQIAAAQIQSAKDEAKKIVDSAKESANLERERIMSDAQNEITKLALAATEKLIKQNSSDALNQFISVTERGDKE